jgi:hypothetical protein
MACHNHDSKPDEKAYALFSLVDTFGYAYEKDQAGIPMAVYIIFLKESLRNQEHLCMGDLTNGSIPLGRGIKRLFSILDMQEVPRLCGIANSL